MTDRPRLKMMIDKLVDLSARGCIDNDWAEQFIWVIKERFEGPYPLTSNQVAKLEELFDRY